MNGGVNQEAFLPELKKIKYANWTNRTFIRYLHLYAFNVFTSEENYSILHISFERSSLFLDRKQW